MIAGLLRRLDGPAPQVTPRAASHPSLGLYASMTTALETSTAIIGYLALFGTVGLVFVLAALVAGRFFRPSNPDPLKVKVYECGEPAIGSSFLQYDLRFYVVALLFIIFDVEVAFFFPWAAVFGKATHLANDGFAVTQQVAPGEFELTDDASIVYRELGITDRGPMAVEKKRGESTEQLAQRVEQSAKLDADKLVRTAVCDIGVFFGVLLVGFAYVWKRGDLDWVRAIRTRYTGPDQE